MPPVELTSSSSDEEEDWSQSWGRETAASPSTMASNLVTLNSRLFQQRPRIGAGAVALVETSSSHNEPQTETGEDEATSEDDFLASDTESDEEVPDLEPANLGSGNLTQTEDSSDEENLSDFSHSWLGSQPDLGPRSTSSPRPSSSPGAWLSDREDLQRMREFLARSSPGSDFNRSTASEEDD